MPDVRGQVNPFTDRLHKVNMQIVVVAVPAQEAITLDNVTVRVDAVVYYRVVDPFKAIINVPRPGHRRRRRIPGIHETRQPATVMAADPAALQLRLLQTVAEVAAEKNSTLVMPFPVELLRFFDNAAPVPGRVQAQDAGAGTADGSDQATDVPALTAATRP